MSPAETIQSLLEEIRRQISDNITPEGECQFDAIKVRMALELVQLELNKSIHREDGNAD